MMTLLATPVRHPRLAAAGLLAAFGLSAVSVFLQPDLAGDPDQTLATLASGPLPAVSAVTFLLAQLPFIVAYLAIGALVETRHRRLGLWGTCLAVLGAFGHTVFGGMSLLYLVMAQNPADRALYATLITDLQSSPVMLFSLAGLAGTVIGMLTLSIGLLRSKVVTRWVAPALWAFLLLEFVGGNISKYAGYLAVLCLGGAFTALAAHVTGSVKPTEHAAPTTALGTASQSA
jgi:hypothetical protein